VTPEQEEQVRRALAALAESEPAGPVPAELTERLDGVLADLVAGRQGGDADELARRRRRRWPRVLVAAAAVAVVAGGTATLVDRTTTDRGDQSSRAGSAAAPATPERTPTTGPVRRPRSSGASAPSGRSLAGGAAGQPFTAASPAPRSPAATGDAPSAATGASWRPPLSSGQLPTDVQSLVDRGLVGDLAVRGDAAASLAPCRVPRAGAGDDLLGVRLDGRRATLLLSAPVSGRRLARVYACDDTAAPEAETTVRPPRTSR
jgi:hypothetical protein